MKENFLFKLWKGNYSLPMAYWGFGVGVILPIKLLTIIFSQKLFTYGYEGGNAIFLFYLLVLLAFAYKIIAVIGIWNSGKNFKGGKIWIVLSRITSLILLT